ncbi:hypothetical protein Gotri_024881 [Gossypium trilobum]|uniref:Uncharacterized protein n=1 Tax=Gossypium trilobum TaxID=34281 RepID=A0A7J9FPU2_9ROSI|nr:hypothetical protein [Gossypium trilobum]
MPPRKSRQTNEQEKPVVANPSKFQNLNVEKYFLELQGKTFIQERGFEPSMILCKETWVLVRYHRWERFCITLKKPTIISVVQEFYASFRYQESRRSCDAIWETIMVMGKKMHVTPREICEFYNVPYYETDFLNNTNLTNFKDIDMDNIANYLTEGRVDTHRSMDLSQYKALYKQPKVWGFLPSPSNGAVQKGWGSNGNKQAIHETNEELNRHGMDDNMDARDGPGRTRFRMEKWSKEVKKTTEVRKNKRTMGLWSKIPMKKRMTTMRGHSSHKDSRIKSQSSAA